MRFETEIRDTAYGGYGIGTFTDGRTAFIPFTVEGDKVIAEMTEDKKKLYLRQSGGGCDPFSQKR
ncbi:MAG: hypothetical protein LRY50_03515 [Geovibrio sp.]|nr:hypothetical protein [Geovibrio sp.]